MSKYNNKKTNGYDSKKEWIRSLELKQMQKDGEIFGLEEQKVFELIPAQYKEVPIVKYGKQMYKLACAEKSCTYKADFVYYDSPVMDASSMIVEDVKGMKTEVYRIKKKLMLHVHGIKIKEV